MFGGGTRMDVDCFLEPFKATGAVVTTDDGMANRNAKELKN